MKIQYFGTAAYEGIPALGCKCETCVKSFQMGGRNIRTRTQALIDDTLLIDFPEDAANHYQTYFYDGDKVRNCLITHNHEDHLNIKDITAMGRGFINSTFKTPFTFYSASSGYRDICSTIGENRSSLQGYVDAVKVEPFKEFTVDGYRVLPLKANHDILSSPVIYAIEKEGKKMLYAHDSGYYFPETWDALKNFGKLDFISLDCTGSKLKDCRNGHMSFDVNLEVLAKMEEEGIVDSSTVKVVNHFSHNGGATYDEMVEIAKPYGITVSYDGLIIEF